MARLPWLDRRLGMDRLTSWHRWVGFSLLWTLLTHAVFIALGYARVTELPPVDELVTMATTIDGILRAIVALVLIIVVGAVSARFVGRLGLPLWRNLRHQLRVAAVVPESGNVVSIHITGRRPDKLPRGRASSSCGGS